MYAWCCNLLVRSIGRYPGFLLYQGRYAVYRPSRWSSANPRMLLVLVREFESRRGDIFSIFAKIKSKNGSTTAESA